MSSTISIPRVPRWSWSICKTDSCCLGVAFAEIPEAREIVPNVNRLAAAVRAAGGLVVWIVTTYDKAIDQEWSIYYRLSTPANGAKRSAALSKGAKGHEIYADLEVKPEDKVVEKRRFSAFIQGSGDLDKVLKARGIDNILISGTVTGDRAADPPHATPLIAELRRDDGQRQRAMRLQRRRA